MRVFISLILFCTFSAYGQDSIPEKVDSVKPHSIKKAVIFSACLPGSGQIYNHIAMPKGKKKAFWKVPLIYAGLGASGYMLIQNQTLKNQLKTEYSNRQDGLPGDVKWSAYDDQGVLTLYEQYLNYRDLSILAVGAVYLLQVVDAGVEAHFVNFDVSEDLSLSIEPTVMYSFDPGIKMTLNFR